MMPRRMLCLALAGWMCVALSACRRKTPSAGPAETVTLTFWHIMNYEGPKEVLAEAVRRFEQANPNARVIVQTFENDAYKQKLSIEIASGAPPDVFFTWGGGGLAALVRAGRVHDLSAEMARNDWQDRFLPAALGMCMVGDRTYAVPLDLSCVPLWYNAELFQQEGLQPPGTFEDFLALCSALRAKGLTPLALGNARQWPGAFYFVYLATRLGGSGLFFDALARRPGKRFDDPAFVRAGEHLRALIAAKAFSAGFNGVEDDQARTQFLNGQAAMYLMGTWLVARAQTEKPDFLDKMKCVPFPAVPGGRGDATTMVGGVNCGFAVSAACRHPEKAVELLRYLTANEVAEAWCRIGRIPALRVGDEAVAALPAPTRAALELLQAARGIQPYYDQALPPRLAEEHKKTTQEIFAGTLSPKEAAERMESAAARAEND